MKGTVCLRPVALSGLTQVNGGLKGRKADLEAKSAFTQSSLLKAAGLKRTVLYMALLSYFRSIVYYQTLSQSARRTGQQDNP